MKTISAKYYIHIIGWIILITYEQALIYFSAGKLSHFLMNALYYAINILLFYTHRRLLSLTAGRIPPRYWSAFALTLSELTLFVLIKGLANIWFFTHSRSLHDFYIAAVLDIYRSVFFIGLSTLVWASAFLERYRKNAAEAERDRALAEARLKGAESAYYQHQLNPHLLFNSLNFIYQKVLDYSDQAAECVLLLSGILRFSISPGGEDGHVTVAEEIEQINNLVRINRFRFEGRLFVELKISGPLGNFRIIPLILLTLTENLFKHGLTTDEYRPAYLSIAVDGSGCFTYECSNYKKRPHDSSVSRKLGIRNSRIRLDQAYPGRYDLVIADLPEQYTLKLMIQLT